MRRRSGGGKALNHDSPVLLPLTEYLDLVCSRDRGSMYHTILPPAHKVVFDSLCGFVCHSKTPCRGRSEEASVHGFWTRMSGKNAGLR